MADSSYTKLRESLVTSTKLIFPDNKVIFGNVNGEEPDNPYVVIRIIKDEQTSMAYNDTLLSPTSQMTTTVNYEILAQFSFLSRDTTAAGDMVKTFVQYLNTPPILEELRKNRLGKKSISQIRNVAIKRETSWIQSYNVDVTFIYAIRTSQTMVPIVTVEVGNDITGEVFTAPPDVVIQR